MFIGEEHASYTLWTSVVRYGVALLVVGLAAGLTLLLPPVVAETPFLFFFAAVMLSTWYGGFGPAVLTMSLAAGWGAYFMRPPLHSLWLEAPADQLELGLFLVVAFLMITLQTRLQRAVAAERVQREYWQTTLASIADGVMVTDAQGNVTALNTVAQRLTGWTLDAAQGKSLPEVFPIYNEETRQPVENPVAKVLRTGTVAGLANQTVLATKEGREIPIDNSAAPIRDEQGRLLGIILVFRDITARKQAEEALHESEQRWRTLAAELQRVNEELQQFAYIVSHDLKEPLRNIAQLVTFLAEDYQDQLDAQAQEYITRTVATTQRLQQMLNDLLAYTQVGGRDFAFGSVDCEALLTTVLEDLGVTIAERNATITHDPLPTVGGDATHLGQVFQNLIGNALKFCGKDSPRIHVSAQRDGAHWRFGIRDNGIGIDPHQAMRLFQVFQRLHTRSQYPGTGIGLAICKKIVERHGGRIWVESAPGQGATFFFTLPAPPERWPVAEESRETSGHPAAGKK